MRVLLIIAALAAGCTPTCKDACKKVLDCAAGGSRLSLTECELSCRDQEALYQSWDDDEKLDAYRAHKQCIGSSTCDEIVSGECDDDLLFVY
jgi:hypothetical protein